MRKALLLLTALLLIIHFTGCGSKKSAEPATGGDKESKKEAAETDAIPVQVVLPHYGDISSFMLFSSNIDSEKMVDIYPMSSGIIKKINDDEGDPVSKGDILAVLDDREAAINEEKARINYQRLEMEFARQKEIYQKQLISKEDYERLRFSREQARLEWKQATLMLSYTRITTPISGIVSKRFIKIGNKISTAQLAFSVVGFQEKIAVVNIPEQEKEHVSKGQRALITSNSHQVPGLVKRISPAIDPESGTFKVTLEVMDKENLLAVGQFVNVKIIKKVHRDALLLVKEALIYEGGKVFVFVLDKENRAWKKEIKPGFDDGSHVEVVEGLLNDEERVVTAGKSSLKNETAVKIVEPVAS
jgi:membrane fusion protein (multidrug efflux system)